MSESLGGPVKMYIAGLLSRDAKSEGWKRDLRICVFLSVPRRWCYCWSTHQLWEPLHYTISAPSGKTAPRVAAFEGHSSSHQERLSLVLLATSWDTGLPGPVGYHVYPQPSAMARHMADEGHITVPRKEDLVDDSVWLPQEMRESLIFYCTIEAWMPLSQQISGLRKPTLNGNTT